MKNQLETRSGLSNKLQPLRAHSAATRAAGKGRRNEGGSVSTVLSGSVNHPGLNRGLPTLIPFLWDGVEVDEEEAVRRAIESGIQWPAYGTHEYATMMSKSLSRGL